MAPHCHSTWSTLDYTHYDIGHNKYIYYVTLIGHLHIRNIVTLLHGADDSKVKNLQ